MPPPKVPASASAPALTNGVQSTSRGSSNVNVVVEAQPKVARKNAGFKPIGAVQTSPAMKRFFPGEDEESESSPTKGKRVEKRVPDSRLEQPRGGVRRSRQGSSTPSSRSDKDGDTHGQRESRHRRTPSRHAEAVDRDVAAQLRREGQHRMRGPSSRQPAPDAVVHQRVSEPSASKPGQFPSVNGKAHASKEISRPSSRQSDLQSRKSVAPSPIEISTDGGSKGERTSEGPKDEIYAIVSQVGEGTFGKVYKARNNITGAHVALKRIRMEAERDGFPVTAMREIKLLQSLRHVNIVQLMEMMVHHGALVPFQRPFRC